MHISADDSGERNPGIFRKEESWELHRAEEFSQLPDWYIFNVLPHIVLCVLLDLLFHYLVLTKLIYQNRHIVFKNLQIDLKFKIMLITKTHVNNQKWQN